MMKIKIFPILAITFLLSSISYGKLQFESPLQQVISVDASQEIHDLEFRFQNIGETPVTIEDVKSTCGCTEARTDKTTYLPGEEGVLSSVYKVDKRIPSRNSIIIVNTDLDAPHRQAVLRLRFEHEGLTQEQMNEARIASAQNRPSVPQQNTTEQPAKFDEPTVPQPVPSIEEKLSSETAKIRSHGENITTISWDLNGSRNPVIHSFKGQKIKSFTSTGDKVVVSYWFDPSIQGSKIMFIPESETAIRDVVKVEFENIGPRFFEIVLSE